MNKPLVSVIMPAYNSANFIQAAIQSVLDQSYEYLELLVVNDGSQDQTEEVVKGFADPRIRYFTKVNGGVSSARNVGLREMKGDFFCFLDADDIFRENSLLSRLQVFEQNPSVSFVDGVMQFVNDRMQYLDRASVPGFRGEPFYELLRLNEKCFIGNTWMIRREKEKKYRFPEDMTHGEELFFYMTIAKGGIYDYTTQTVLLYRQTEGSAMKNISGLECGYLKLLKNVKDTFPHEPIHILRRRILRIMFLSWLIDGRNPIKAILSVIKFLK